MLGYAMIQVIVVGYAGRLVLPFEPLTIAFKDVQYYVDMPPVIKCN
jgi:hypothetical protein